MAGTDDPVATPSEASTSPVEVPAPEEASTRPQTPDSTELEPAADQYERFERIFAGVDPPFAFVDIDALWWNAADMLRRAAGVPIRVATKSVRCRSVLRRLLSLDRGFGGLLTFTLPETLFLWEHGFRNLVVAYPSVERDALAALARLTAAEPDAAPVLMVDCPEHLDLIESAARGAGISAPVRVAIDVDASLRLFGGSVAIGVKRSPIHSVEQARALAREIERRKGVRLVGLMAYEAQIAGVGDNVPGKPLTNVAVRAMQWLSARDLGERRAAVVEGVQEITPLEFVNGGGTGSIEMTASEGAVTEVAAGSGFYAPVLFDHYRGFDLRPAAIFALSASRRPSSSVVTALGGGYVASGEGGKGALPQPYLPAGLRLDKREGAGEVQTPLLGPAASEIAVGDRVYMRHVKAGELCERFERIYLLAGETIIEEAPTYRGDGHAFA